MSDLEDQLRGLFRDKESQAPLVRPLSEYLSNRGTALSRRWQWLAVPAAVVVTAAVVIGATQLSSLSGDTAAPVVTGSSSTAASGSPVGGHGPLSNSEAVTCVDQYSPEAVTRRSFAFDGTVRSIGPGTSNGSEGSSLGLAVVTFDVNQWFLGGTQTTVTVDMGKPGDEDPTYSVGTRLLVAGEPRWGGFDPLADAITWDSCGYVRYWDQQTAQEWLDNTDEWVSSLERDPCWMKGLSSGVPDYAAPRPVDETPPIELAARFVEGTGLDKQYPNGRLVVADVGESTQAIWLVSKDRVVGEFRYRYGEYGWEIESLEHC